MFDTNSKAQPAISDRVDPLHTALVLTRPCRVHVLFVKANFVLNAFGRLHSRLEFQKNQIRPTYITVLSLPCFELF